MKTEGRRGLVQGETGSGKGVVIGHMVACAAERGSCVLILADRRRLVKQLSDTLGAFQVGHGKIMAGESQGTRDNIIIASRDTLKSWNTAERVIKTPDLILIDEAHKTAASTYQAILSRYPNAYVVGFTATPARDDGKSLGDFYQWLKCTIPASELIRQGWLIKPEVYAPIELAKQRGKGTGKGMAGDPVSHWQRHADGLPTIAFASKVEESIALRDRFLAAGIPAEHIDASISDAERWDGRSDRDEYFDRLANGKTCVLCSVGLMIEGVDIPEASAVIIWSKFGSVVKWRQANGRVMRPCPRIGKTRAVCLDHAGAAGIHGLPGDDVDWSLDFNVMERRAKDLDEHPNKKTIICRGCGACYSSAPACPMCGMDAPRMERKKAQAEQYEATKDEILSRFDGEQAQSRQAEQLQREWRKCIYIAVARNGKAGMAAAMFASKCKVQPWNAGVDPLPENRGDWRLPAADVFPSFAKSRA